MNKKQIYEYLKEKHIGYEITEHRAVFSMNEINEIDMPHPEADAKNIFVRDKKKENYYLITVKGNKRVDLKKFRAENGTSSLSFASAEELADILQLMPGSVSPFGLLNDHELKVKFFIDKDFMNDEHLIGIHPNENTATVWLKVENLIEIIKENGNQVNLIEI